MLGLFDPAGYESLFGVPSTLKGDTDMDGDHDVDDIAQFVAILSGDQAPSGEWERVPEPPPEILLALGLLAVLCKSGLASNRTYWGLGG